MGKTVGLSVEPGRRHVDQLEAIAAVAPAQGFHLEGADATRGVVEDGERKVVGHGVFLSRLIG